VAPDHYNQWRVQVARHDGLSHWLRGGTGTVHSSHDDDSIAIGELRSQHAAVAALTLTSDDWMADVVRVMQEKRDYVWSRLLKIPHIGPTLSTSKPPAGAFYVLVDISAYLRPSLGTSSSAPETLDTTAFTTTTDDAHYATDTELCLALLQTQRLAVVPGSAFGAPGTMRLSYATDMETLVTAMDKLEAFLATIRS
jgi:aspartate/methionine/tyrosine aminotransferase